MRQQMPSDLRVWSDGVPDTGGAVGYDMGQDKRVPAAFLAIRSGDSDRRMERRSMSNSARPTEPSRYGPPPRLGIHPEGGGFVVTCKCLWLRMFPTRPAAEAGRREHEKRCRTARGEGDE